jgi:hypothetical protein
MTLSDLRGPHRLTGHCRAVGIEVTLSDGLRSARRCDRSF